jgi:hypothetical protein
MLVESIVETEEWRAVVGWEGFYRVSNIGRVWSLPRIVVTHGTPVARSGRFLKPNTEKKVGRQLVVMCVPGRKKKAMRIHRLVMEAFVGPMPEGMIVCHNNGNPADNRLENLRYDTCAGNTADTAKHGRVPLGESHALAKLTEVEAIAIREEAIRPRGQRRSFAKIAGDYRVSPSTVAYIAKGRIWKHLP